jgi:hypothetical protein
MPLTSWFLAMWLVATAKNGISSVELGRRLGIKQTNAWALKQKLMHVMAERDGKKRLDGRVEMDDAYLSGRPPPGPALYRRAAAQLPQGPTALQAIRSRSQASRRASVQATVEVIVPRAPAASDSLPYCLAEAPPLAAAANLSTFRAMLDGRPRLAPAAK